MLNIQENVDIKKYATFKMGGKFRYFIELNNIKDVNKIVEFSREKNLPIFILGSGSNCLFKEGILDIIALKINIKGFELINEEGEHVDIKVGAGEITDDIVNKTVSMNLMGMESLSAIPGTIGATPIQNVGAYGTEVKDIITSVIVFNIKDNEFKNLLNSECKFGYRDSIFKNEARGKYIIIQVVFRLKKVKNNDDLLKKRQEIINTRWSKLPKPEELPNVGSFFKNPIVSKEKALKILIDYPSAKFFPIDEEHTKIPAGWLIEMSGLRGRSFGKIAVYDKNALVLVNTNGATIDDVIDTKNQIIKTVEDKFGVTLEQEPEII